MPSECTEKVIVLSGKVQREEEKLTYGFYKLKEGLSDSPKTINQANIEGGRNP